MAGATVALAHGFESIYYNPAGIAISRQIHIAIGYQWSGYALTIRSPALAGHDQASAARDAENQETIGGINIGAALFLPLKAPLHQRIALGFGIYIPNEVVLSANLPRPYTPQFVVMGNRGKVVAIQLGGAVRFTEWLSIGGGVRALSSLIGAITIQPNEFGTLGSEVKDELIAAYSPIAGIIVTPKPWLKFGMTYRGTFAGKFALPISPDLGASFKSFIGVPTLQIEGVAQYDPRQFLFASAWNVWDTLWIELGASWRRWSEFAQPVRNTVDCIPCDPNDPTQPWCDPQNTVAHCLPELPDPAFSDTLSPRIGAEWTEMKLAHNVTIDVRAGYSFEPTPVPEQTELTNLLDNDRHIWAIGGTFNWWVRPTFIVHLDLYFQHHILVSRTHRKSEPWPPSTVSETEYKNITTAVGDLDFRPYIQSGGSIFSAGTSLGIKY